MPDCLTLLNGKHVCTFRIDESSFGANVVMQGTCDTRAVRHTVLGHVREKALEPCSPGKVRQSERSNNALLTDAYFALRASSGAAKRER
jgi:hypothetical protein